MHQIWLLTSQLTQDHYALNHGQNDHNTMSMGNQIKEVIIHQCIVTSNLFVAKSNGSSSLHFEPYSKWSQHKVNRFQTQMKIKQNVLYFLLYDSEERLCLWCIITLPYKVKTQYLHFRSHAKYFLLSWKIPEVISRRSILFHN